MRSVPEYVYESRVSGRKLQAVFDGGRLSSDGGLVILRAAEKRAGVVRRLASCIEDRRDPGKVRQSVRAMLTQRILGLCCGYEDCNDFNTLRQDPLLKIASDRLPEGGEDLASQPTLSRLENSVRRRDLYRMGVALVEAFIARHQREEVRRIILDADGTEDPTYGQQELAFSNGYYRRPCYVPLLVFATVETREQERDSVTGEESDAREEEAGRCRTSEREQEMLCAFLRSGKTAPSTMVVPLLKRLLKRLRQAFPAAEIVFRGDSGFASPSVYACVEAAGAGYAVALAKNSALESRSEDVLTKAREAYSESGQDMQAFSEFRYQAKRWKTERRVVVKVEISKKFESRRYVVTNQAAASDALYAFYAERGDVENRIKEMKEDMFSGRTSCRLWAANQFRLLLHAAAMFLMQSVRCLLSGTEMGKMQADSLRCRLLKVAVRVVQTTRRIVVQLPSGYPWRTMWERILGPPGAVGA